MGRHIASIAMFSLISAFSDFLSAQESSITAGIVQFNEGETFLDGNAFQLAKDSIRLFQTGQTLSTKQGRLELTFASNTNLSLGENASLRMEQSNLMTLEKGSILIEVVRKLTNPIKVRILNSTVEIRKPGLYRLDSRPCNLRVYGGTALVDNGSEQAQIKRKREIRLDGDLSQSKFDPKDSDTLHQWSAHRSLDIFLTNPETDNWKRIGNRFLFENSNYRARFLALPKYPQKRRVPWPGMPCIGCQTREEIP